MSRLLAPALLLAAACATAPRGVPLVDGLAAADQRRPGLRLPAGGRGLRRVRTGRRGRELLRTQPGRGAGSHGFDVFFGTPYPNDHGPERLDKAGRTRGFPPIPLLRGEAVVEQPAQLAKLPERFVAEAKQFIAANRDRPFYLHFANIETHTPWFVSRRFQGKSKAGVYGDAVQCLDWAVGELLNTLDRLALTGNTLVILTSDNGPVLDDGYADQAVEKVGTHKPAGRCAAASTARSTQAPACRSSSAGPERCGAARRAR